MTQQTSDDQVVGRPAYAMASDVAAVSGDLASLSASLGTAATEDASTFEVVTNKGIAGGYASLNGSGLVPVSQMASGTPDGTKFVRDDGTLAVPSAGAGVSDGDKGDITVSSGGSVWTIDNLVITDAKVAAANKDGASATASMRTLGTGAAQACAGNDSRLSDSRAPTGAASGDLGGTYPSPTVTQARGIRETSGPTTLTVGSVADGEFVKRSGSTLIGGTPSAGSDPWTNVVLGADFATTSASNTNVTGLAFTPTASKTYLIEAYCLLRTTTATVGPRPGMSTPSGSDGAFQITAPNSNTALAFQAQGTMGAAATNAASTGVPLTTASYLGIITAVIVTGSSPSGSVQITLASETAGTSVTMRAGSFLRYRTIS